MEGLTSVDAKNLQQKYGKNELIPKKKESLIKKLFHVVCEPMFLLLLIAAVIYFILGEPGDGTVMLVFIVGIISIELIQEVRTDNTLNALKDLSSPKVVVVRDGQEILISSFDLVPGDIIMISEGIKIPADGSIIKCNDLCVDESSLTGESEGVWKVETDADARLNHEDYRRNDYCYAGTMVTQGSAYVLVDKIGENTQYGKIGKSLSEVNVESTPLQKQINSLIKVCAIIAGLLFLLVLVFTFIGASQYAIKDRIIESVLSGVTLAMAMIPEEFPVILTVFLSMGAWRLAKKQSLVRKLPAVETLGAVSVICTDKTGTLTMNQMTVEEVFAPDNDIHKLCGIMGLGCETDPYDPMEKAMLSYCETLGIQKNDLFSEKLIKEYAFTSELKMMGHVWQRSGKIIAAIKGSPEKVLKLCELTGDEYKRADDKIKMMSRDGLRVIAVATQNIKAESEIPEDITKCNLEFCGIVGLADPLRESIKRDIKECKKAQIRVVMITGDNGTTACAIAKKAGISVDDNVITGDMIDSMSDEELMEKVKCCNVFSRVIPEHKMRIVKAFKDNGEIVAMIGDGVNDAPALKYSDIGISMGKRGSEVSREAADLILMDDNFTTIVHTVRDGRRIYDNIRKAVGYIFTIHIPIALASLLAPVLGVGTSSLLFLPLQVVLMELIIDPTSSIVFERQPAENNIMVRPPRNPKSKLSSAEVFIKSVIQGIAIFIASFGSYFFILSQNANNVCLARTVGISVIVFSNLFLVWVNSSETELVIRSIKRFLRDKITLLINTLIILGLIVLIYSPLNSFFGMQALSVCEFLAVILLAFVSVFWYEIVKIVKNR